MKTTGFVLAKSHYEKFDAIVSIFTKDFGLQRFLVRSFDKPHGKLKSIFYPFYKVELTFVSNETINLLKTGCLLEEYQIKSFFQGLNFFYLSRFIEKIQPENVPDEAVFKLLERTFRLLARLKDKKSIFNTMTNFERRIFGLAGFYDVDKDRLKIFSQKEIRAVLDEKEILELRSLIFQNVS